MSYCVNSSELGTVCSGEESPATLNSCKTSLFSLWNLKFVWLSVLKETRDEQSKGTDTADLSCWEILVAWPSRWSPCFNILSQWSRTGNDFWPHSEFSDLQARSHNTIFSSNIMGSWLSPPGSLQLASWRRVPRHQGSATRTRKRADHLMTCSGSCILGYPISWDLWWEYPKRLKRQE